MRSGGPIKRRTPLRKRNPERLARLRKDQFGPQGELCVLLPCSVCGRPPPSDPAHIRTRGAGGKGRGNIIPLCRLHHQEQGSMPIADFEALHGISMQEIADEVEKQAYPD